MLTVAFDHEIFTLQSHGGVSRYVCELATHLAGFDDIAPMVVAPIHFNEHLAQSKAPTAGVYIKKCVPKSGPFYRAVSDLVTPWSALRHRPKVHHSSYLSLPRAFRGAARVVTVHDMIQELFPQHFPARDPIAHRKRVAVAEADHVICVSQRTADDLIRLIDVNPAKVTVVHSGVGGAHVSSNPGIPLHRRPYVLYVGHRSGHKNFDFALRAFASSARLREDFDLVLFGGPPVSSHETRLAQSLRLRGDGLLHRTGDDDDLASAYGSARAMVYPSLYEGFGHPPLEAMQAGCVVACSSGGSIPEVVGEAGVFFDPTDIERARVAIESACYDESVRVGLIKAGRQRAASFSWQRCAAETRGVYLRLS